MELVKPLPEMAAVKLCKVRDSYLGLIRAEEVETLLRSLKVRRLGTAKLEYFLQTLFRENNLKGEDRAKVKSRCRSDKDKVIVTMLDTMIKNATKESRKKRGKYWHIIGTLEEEMKAKLHTARWQKVTMKLN